MGCRMGQNRGLHRDHTSPLDSSPGFAHQGFPESEEQQGTVLFCSRFISKTLHCLRDSIGFKPGLFDSCTT